MMAFKEVLEAAQQLSLAEKMAIIQVLQREIDEDSKPITREQLLAEIEARREAGVLGDHESLMGKYANPDAAAVTDEELHEYLRQVGKEWEEELDEL
jgi:hypothetical protein